MVEFPTKLMVAVELPALHCCTNLCHQPMGQKPHVLQRLDCLFVTQTDSLRHQNAPVKPRRLGQMKTGILPLLPKGTIRHITARHMVPSHRLTCVRQ